MDGWIIYIHMYVYRCIYIYIYIYIHVDRRTSELGVLIGGSGEVSIGWPQTIIRQHTNSTRKTTLKTIRRQLTN